LQKNARSKIGHSVNTYGLTGLLFFDPDVHRRTDDAKDQPNQGSNIAKKVQKESRLEDVEHHQKR
jgi:ribosomal 30S subunit maturation factor RimM